MNMNGLVFTILALVAVVMIFKLLPKGSVNPKADDPRTRDQLRALILGKAKRTVITTRYGFTTNEAENKVIGLREHYKFGKMFELASKSPSGELPLSNGDKIAPHSREHGLSAGRNADLLRIHILKEYGIDIASMEDLEVGDEEFIVQRKAELIAKIKREMNQPDGPVGSDDDGNGPMEG